MKDSQKRKSWLKIFKFLCFPRWIKNEFKKIEFIILTFLYNIKEERLKVPLPEFYFLGFIFILHGGIFLLWDPLPHYIWERNVAHVSSYTEHTNCISAGHKSRFFALKNASFAQSGEAGSVLEKSRSV